MVSEHCKFILAIPIFLTSSDNPGVNLINVNFDGASYANWCTGVLISLSAKNKLGFINGSCPCPSSDSPLIDQWQRCNDMVIAWLLNSRSRDIAESVIYSQKAEELGMNWRRGMVKQMCGAKTHNIKINEDQKLIQLLMGFNDAYSGVRANILMMKPLPSTAQAYSILIHQESQKELHSNSSFINDSTAFMTSGQKWNAQRTTNNYKSTNLIHNARIKKNDVYCKYCKKTWAC
ncbi:uncharacterized protein LOC107792195 [Nicotiana tabacum]|uniref:Uncharacterized protein LOC107792195 n=1 Tax=Nicotiana tabacum TaxID=4097 RepID=A0A1S3ZZV7_TOBAC